MARIKTDNESSRKDVILKASAALFREKGYKAASMRDLAERVGVEAASLYNHIRAKTELLRDICFDVAEHYFEHMNYVEASQQNAIAKVETLLRFHIGQMLHNYEEVYVSDREWRHLPEKDLLEYQEKRRIYRKKFAAIIEEGITHNQIKQIDVPTAVLIMLHAISGIESWHRSTQKISGEELEKNMLTILLKGLQQ